MQINILQIALFATMASAQQAKFILYEHSNFGGSSHTETRNTGSDCWNMNGKGDQASSVRNYGTCTTFFRERDCKGSSWQQIGDASTVPSFLNDHIWSFRNQCCDSDRRAKCNLACGTSCAAAGPQGIEACLSGCIGGCTRAYSCV
ncbi:hypothetical protein FSPOR_1669 [Fusarium sporotrichioides]|uniref:Uncharacterized protein n=1 Tax=Fusarium sporotrichioides TaxID=5514 RepID=A0A395SPR1_FUSSP|nr:hypothetical protein FSPOR_1669 [Fusarium sporotrichioides]